MSSSSDSDEVTTIRQVRFDNKGSHSQCVRIAWDSEVRPRCSSPEKRKKEVTSNNKAQPETKQPKYRPYESGWCKPQGYYFDRQA